MRRPARRSGPTSMFRVIFFFALALTSSLAPRATATELDVPIFSGGYGTAFYEETARLFEQQRPGVTVNPMAIRESPTRFACE